ncbi:uncharacterized protein TNCV_2368721 [Trichonephila clavipes]|nr:uncharacterized protein TNCV_2368721 [Trichonephila clavipes]
MEIEEEETVEEEVCGCKDFQPMPREMQGRRKDRLSEYVGFYDSLFEKPEMSEEGIELQAALGKDVWGSVERYLRQYLVWFHIMVKHDMFDTFRKEMEKIRDQFVMLPFWCLCDEMVNEKAMKYFLTVEFKAPTHLMILIPAKMNSPDYDDFLDMFSLTNPV